MSHDPGDSLGLTAKEDSDLAVSSLGACVHCLTRCLIERNILSMKSFTVSGCGRWVWLTMGVAWLYLCSGMNRWM